MSGQAVLIAGYSGRALAASARRAGYVPLVVDAFDDLDTRTQAGGVRCLPEAVAHGFRAAPLIEALQALIAESGCEPIGLVLGAGFEDAPVLIATLQQSFRLLGCSADSVRRCSDPATLFALLAERGIRHPETRLSPPADGRGWLSKLAGGSGGTHIARCKAKPTALPHRYFQRDAGGEGISAMAIVGGDIAFAYTRQWVAPAPRRPFRYGGAVSQIDLDDDVQARIIDTAVGLSKALELKGMVSFDFLVNEGEPLLVDVNPRPGATLDILDDDQGVLFRAHVAAVTGGDAIDVLRRGQPSATATAAAYLYADRGPVAVPDLAWPDWSADRPAPGTVVTRYAPLATVFATGATPEAAEQTCRKRLAALDEILYQGQKMEDAQP